MNKLADLWLLITLLSNHEVFGQDCQKEMYEPHGVIESPGYPENYPDEESCVYRVMTKLMINVVFTKFILEASYKCSYDYLRLIFDATSRNATNERFCGNGLGKVNGGRLRGPGPLVAVFVSDDSSNFQGFKFTYDFELNGPDPCASNPCQNGALCNMYPDYYICDCSPGFAGVNCDVDKDECLSYPCRNGGTCIDGSNQFTCECLDGFSGSTCEITPDWCDPDPCENGGLCIDRIRDFVCSCSRDFMGDKCQDPVPTLPPKTTIPPPTTTTTTTTVVATTTEITTTIAPSESESKDGNKGTNQESESRNGSMATIIIIVLLIIFLLLALIGWFWWKKHRSSKNMKPNREVTLINMKTRSERDEGKNGRRLATSTSINSISMKGEKGDGLINHLKKMSEDIIMEEVTDNVANPTTKLHQPSVTITSNPTNPQAINSMMSSDPNNHNLRTLDPNLQKISIPLTQNELNKMTDPNRGFFNGTYRNETLPLSPEEAVNLLNQIKQNNGTNYNDNNQTAMNMYNASGVAKNPFTNTEDGNWYNKQPPNSMFQQPPQQPYPLPLLNVPSSNGAPHNFEYKQPQAKQHNKKPKYSDDEGMELSPGEAANVINHFLKQGKLKKDTVNPQEALEIINQVKNRRQEKNRPMFQREKSVTVNSRDIANLVNRFREKPRHIPPSETNLSPSVYEFSENEERHPMKANRNFREYSPIQEESNVSEDDQQYYPSNKHQRINQGYETEEAPEQKPVRKRVRKKTKQFPYARTLDPDEKVHDWLKNSANKQKTKKYRNIISPPESLATDVYGHNAGNTHEMERSRPNHIKPTFDSPPTNRVGEENKRPKKIKQGRKGNSGQQRLLPVTENKAKSLVEKLIKAPVRSTQNIVGPGLGVARENAFVGEEF